MAKTKKRTACLKAIEFVREKIQNGHFPEGQPLLPVRELAKQAGVSVQTMVNAQKSLKEEGILSGGGGFKYTVEESGAKESASIKKKASCFSAELKKSSIWRKVQSEIEKDILKGFFSSHSFLPTLEELSARYGAHRKTIAKALAKLVDDGLLIPSGRRYAVRKIGASEAKKNRIVFLGYGYDRNRIVMGENDYTFTLALERFAHSRNITIDYYSYAEQGNQISFCSQSNSGRSPFPQGDDILGYVNFILDFPAFSKTLIYQLSQTGKPSVLIDIPGSSVLPWKEYRNPHFKRFIYHNNSQASQDIARYLLAKGHRHIAFFSAWHEYPWSLQRLAGLKKIFSEFGEECSVAEFCFSNKNFDKKGLARPEAGAIIDAILKAEQSLSSQYTKSVYAAFKTHGGLFRDCETALVLGKDFETAYKDSRISAWVTVNDIAGERACDYLNEKKSRSSRKIELISFDNSSIALEANFTSYDFNTQSMFGAMFDFLLRPMSITGMLKKRNTFTFDGILVER